MDINYWHTLCNAMVLWQASNVLAAQGLGSICCRVDPVVPFSSAWRHQHQHVVDSMWQRDRSGFRSDVHCFEAQARSDPTGSWREGQSQREVITRQDTYVTAIREERAVIAICITSRSVPSCPICGYIVMCTDHHHWLHVFGLCRTDLLPVLRIP